jgi:sulfur carrier protein ThiS
VNDRFSKQGLELKGGKAMDTIQVRLFGKLRLDRFGGGRPVAGDGSFPVMLKEGSTVREAMDNMRIPAAQVGVALVNGRDCPADTPVTTGDRVVLVPQEFAALWPAWLRSGLETCMGCGS